MVSRRIRISPEKKSTTGLGIYLPLRIREGKISEPRGEVRLRGGPGQ